MQSKLSRRLAFALGISCVVNVTLLAFGLYEWQEGGYAFLLNCPYRPQKGKVRQIDGSDLPTLTKTLRELEQLAFDELILQLGSDDAVCDGYRRQDIALGLLVDRHYFDVQRALGNQVELQRRLFRYVGKENEQAEIILYPELSSEQYAKLRDFAKIERYPITAQGVFERIKTSKEPELVDYFSRSDEYACVDTLLRRGINVSKEDMLAFILALDWQTIKAHADAMRERQSFTPDVRRAFLVKSLPHSSKILLDTDSHFALHSLSDAQVIQVLSSGLLTKEQSRSYALGLLESPRSEAVWNKAVTMLCQVAELDPAQESRSSMLQRFGRKIAGAKTETTVPEQAKKTQIQKVESPKPAIKKPASAPPLAKTVIKPVPKREIIHTVKPGDTLWQIAKRYKVDVDCIKKRNNLKSDALKPGSTIVIPTPPSLLPNQNGVTPKK